MVAHHDGGNAQKACNERANEVIGLEVRMNDIKPLGGDQARVGVRRPTIRAFH